MSPGDIILAEIPANTGRVAKLRPALVLATLPGPYQRWLLCGISTQLENIVQGWDELLDEDADWFGATGLARRSAIRLSFIAAASVAPRGRLGAIPGEMLSALRGRLARYLAAPAGLVPETQEGRPKGLPS